MRYIIEETKTEAGTRKIPITEDVVDVFRAIIENREPHKVEKVIDGYTGFLFYDENDMPLVAIHWQHIKGQTLIQKQPSNLEGCFCIYARKA